LDLVADEQDVMFLAEGIYLCKIILIGDYDTRLALNRLTDERSSLGSILFKDSLQIGYVAVADRHSRIWVV
jgi:hypothetical protein